MLSSIPSNKRSANVLNRIHIMISRFIQLREMSSNFDKNKNVVGFIHKTANDRPLANYLSDFKNNLYWIMMVAKNDFVIAVAAAAEEDIELQLIQLLQAVHSVK